MVSSTVTAKVGIDLKRAVQASKCFPPRNLHLPIDLEIAKMRSLSDGSADTTIISARILHGEFYIALTTLLTLEPMN